MATRPITTRSRGEFDVEELPNEMILQVCQQMSTQELGKFVRSNKRVRDICQKELSKREGQKYKAGYIGTFFEDVFNEIRKRATQHIKRNQEYWSPEGDFIEEYEEDYLDLRRLYFKGNLYHALLNLQRYLYSNSQGRRPKLNVLDSLMIQIFEELDPDETEALKPQEMVNRIAIEIVNQDQYIHLKKNQGPIIIQ